MPAIKRGQTSVLQSQLAGIKSCVLTWYDPALGGTNSASGAANPSSKTASGEPYDPNADTCAAPANYPFGTLITFTYNFKSVVCKVNDRGGAITGDHFDLSRHAANTLGIINSGRVNAQFSVSGTAGQSGSAAAANAAAASGPAGGGFTLKLGSLFSIAAGDLAQFVFDAFIKFPAVLIGDYIIIPTWHWNQRAVMYFQQTTLFGDQTGKVTVGIAAFWGLGYVLLWGDADAKGLDMFKRGRTPRNSHLARHIQRAQSLPARKRLVKPRDIKSATATKPKPQISTVPVTQVGTMATSRPQRVTVHGHRANETRPDQRFQPSSRAGARRIGEARQRFKAEIGRDAQPVPNSRDRTRLSSPENRGGNSNGHP